MSGQWSRWIGTHSGYASEPAPIAIIASNHTIIDCTESVFASRRTVIAEIA